MMLKMTDDKLAAVPEVKKWLDDVNTILADEIVSVAMDRMRHDLIAFGTAFCYVKPREVKP